MAYTMLNTVDFSSTPSTSTDDLHNNSSNFHLLLEDLEFSPEKSKKNPSNEHVAEDEYEEENTEVQYPYQRKNKYEDLMSRIETRLNDGSMQTSEELNLKVKKALDVINKTPEITNGKKFGETKFYTCLFCSKYFGCTVSLNEHIADEHDFTKNPHRCQKCGNSYKYKKNLELHLEKHELKLEYDCKLCSMVFRSSVSLDAHSARVHQKNADGTDLDDADVTRCPVCKKEFAESALKRHMYYCENRNEILTKRAEKKSISVPPSPALSMASVSSFTSLGSLTPKASYVDKSCKVCGQSFASRQSMLRHITRKHPELKDDQTVTAVTYVSVDSPNHQYACEECGKRLTTRAALSLHKERIHKKSCRYECEICNKSYPIPSELRKHMQRSHQKNSNIPAEISEEIDLTTF